MSAREHEVEWRRLRASGATLQEISDQYGISRARIHQLTGTFRVKKVKPPPKKLVEPKPTAARSFLMPKRERWTYPDRDLLKVAHEARDEIRENVRRGRYYP